MNLVKTRDWPDQKGWDSINFCRVNIISRSLFRLLEIKNLEPQLSRRTRVWNNFSHHYVSHLLTYLVTKNTDPGQSRGKPRQVQPGKENLQVITAVIRPMQLNKSTRGRTKRQNKLKWRGRVISSCRVTPVDKFLEVKQLTVKIFSVKLFTLLSETLFGGKFTLSTQLMVLCWHSGLNFSIFPM